MCSLQIPANEVVDVSFVLRTVVHQRRNQVLVRHTPKSNAVRCHDLCELANFIAVILRGGTAHLVPKIDQLESGIASVATMARPLFSGLLDRNSSENLLSKATSRTPGDESSDKITSRFGGILKPYLAASFMMGRFCSKRSELFLPDRSPSEVANG